jgi:anti-sigma regulatory factor (Ser/Thr protein kinase)
VSGSVELSISSNVDAPGYARRWLRDVLAQSSMSRELLEDTVLVVDELVTNAVVHAATPIVVALEFGPSGCRCSVTDRRSAGPMPRLVEGTDGSGRGLRLVDAVSSEWGVERSDVGTRVWASIAPAAATSVASSRG